MNSEAFVESAKLKLVIILAVAVALLSGYVVLHRISKNSSKTEEVRLVKVTASRKIVKNQEQPPALDMKKAAAAPDTRELLPRNILFTFAHFRATAAYVTGEFNDWGLTPMEKEKPGTWRLAMPIIPGTYKYNFVAKGNKYLDKYNPRRVKTYSILIVEPHKQK